MALTKEQYDSIMLEYSQARDLHHRELVRRRNQVYARIPEYRELESDVLTLGMQQLRSALMPEADEKGSAASVSLREHLDEIGRKKRQLLLDNGFPENYLAPVYDCPDCQDTGYIGTQKCHCLKSREIRVLYDQSHLQALFRTNNFSVLSYEFYTGEDLAHFRKAVNTCRSFIENFKISYENLYFYGTVGTGKSFLSICTAQELLSQGFSVLYFSASGLFERLSSYVFSYNNKEDYQRFCSDLYGCDLLIIDDLGTELMSSFVSAQLFSCINERHLGRKSTMISTNLNLPELRDRYSDRVYSRIISEYTPLKLTGPDIRILKKYNMH